MPNSYLIRLTYYESSTKSMRTEEIPYALSFVSVKDQAIQQWNSWLRFETNPRIEVINLTTERVDYSIGGRSYEDSTDKREYIRENAFSFWGRKDT